ncbi:MAG: 30S ribosomal protein S6 [Christensenellaceae bacterium]|nr:30S ribosomal protein S6 [Christensenellaceae bacterium]
MTKYEMLYIITPSVSEDGREALIKKFSEYVTSRGGTVENTEKMGIKRLAYPIKFKQDGFYVLMNYSADPKVSSEMEKLMHITDGILRTIIIKRD